MRGFELRQGILQKETGKTSAVLPVGNARIMVQKSLI
jgi:hypothetical protein